MSVMQKHALLVSVSLLVLAGCGGSAPKRITTQIIEVPRVDVELEGVGNRGYLIGTPPPATVKTTRQIMATTVELPGLSDYTGPESGQSPAALPPTVQGISAKAPASNWESQAEVNEYIVQEGDSLWSIAAKPQVYGKASNWNKLYEANKEMLGTPEGIKVGMRLTVPRQAPNASESREGSKIQFSK